MRVLALLGLAFATLCNLLVLDVVVTTCPPAKALPMVAMAALTLTLPAILLRGRS